MPQVSATRTATGRDRCGYPRGRIGGWRHSGRHARSSPPRRPGGGCGLDRSDGCGLLIGRDRTHPGSRRRPGREPLGRRDAGSAAASASPSAAVARTCRRCSRDCRGHLVGRAARRCVARWRRRRAAGALSAGLACRRSGREESRGVRGSRRGRRWLADHPLGGPRSAAQPRQHHRRGGETADAYASVIRREADIDAGSARAVRAQAAPDAALGVAGRRLGRGAHQPGRTAQASRAALSTCSTSG